MILRPAQIYQMRMGRQLTPANFGGDSDSDSSTTTTNDVKNYATSIDKRAVASDNAVSLTGDNNSIDRSQSTSFTDTSNRSTSSITSFLDNSVKDSSTNFTDYSSKDSSTHFTDLSNKDSSTKFSDSSIKDSSVKTTNTNSGNTQFTDSSNRSVTTINQSTDYGSVGGSLTLAGAMTTQAFGVAGKALDGTMGVLKQSSDDSQKSIMAAFGAAAATGKSAAQNSADVLGFASAAIKQTGDAFAEAKDGGQSKMMMAAIAAVAVVGVAFALK